MFVHSLVKFGVKSGGLFLTDKANGAEMEAIPAVILKKNLKHLKQVQFSGPSMALVLCRAL